MQIPGPTPDLPEAWLGERVSWGRGQLGCNKPPPGVQVKPCSTSASLEAETHVQRCMSVESTKVDSLLQTDQGPWG